MAPKDPAEALAAEEETRHRILDAALEAFAEKGYAGTSTLMIATRAKVSKRDLYALFPSKEAMLAACAARRSERMGMPGGLPDPRDRAGMAATLEAFGVNFLTQFLDPGAVSMFRLAIGEAVQSPEIARRIGEARRATRAKVSDYLARAQAAGLLPAGDPAEMAGRYFALTSEDLMLSLLLNGEPHPDRQRIERRAAESAAAFMRLYPIGD